VSQPAPELVERAQVPAPPVAVKPRRPRRAVDGVLLLDKPCGVTSNAALQKVKWLYQAQKAGHTGSLDPLATGVLPICLGRATRLAGLLLDADKGYEVTARLGVRTDSADAEGAVIAERPVPPLTAAGLEAVLDDFRGSYDQVPPMHSAVQINGQRLYTLARRGEVVERPARRVHVHELELLELGADFLRLRMQVSKGFYVRTLVDEMGERLGCGAHVVALRRTRVGDLTLDRAVDLPTLQALVDDTGRETHVPLGLAGLDAYLLSADVLVSEWPAVQLDRESSWFVRNGQPVYVPRAPTAGWVRLYGAGQEFLGLAEVVSDGRLAPRRLLAAAAPVR